MGVGMGLLVGRKGHGGPGVARWQAACSGRRTSCADGFGLLRSPQRLASGPGGGKGAVRFP